VTERTDHGHTETREHAYETALRPNPDHHGMVTAALVAGIGLWILAEVSMLGPMAGTVWGGFGIGVVLLLLGGYNLYRRSAGWTGSLGVSVAIAVIGLALALLPFAVGSTAAGVLEGSWIRMLRGIALVALGAYGASQTMKSKRDGITAPN
jgi:hypothetical protein